jgi:photosystem II stability/assembly factor-like uncharacterized protein
MMFIAIPRLYSSAAFWHHFRTLAIVLAGVIGAQLSHGAAATQPPRLLLDVARVGRDLVTVGERGAILRSSDEGKTWQASPRVTKATLTGVAFAPALDSAAAGRGWAVGHDAIILTTIDGGRTWSKQYQGDDLEESLLDVLAVDAQRVLAIGANRLFLETDDGGSSWRRRSIVEEESHLNRITRGPTGTLYIAGEHGTLLRSTDRGLTWTRISAPSDGSFYGILALDASQLLAYGLRGRVYRSLDDGGSWELIPTPQPSLLAAAVQLKSEVILLAGSAPTLLASRDRGKTFDPVGPTGAQSISDILELPDGNVLAVGESGVVAIAVPR